MGIESLLRKKAEQEKTEIKPLVLVETLPTLPTQPKIDNPTKDTPPRHPTQPMRDFIKYPNSVNRNTDRLFRGMNKETYDKLYNLTRGAFPNPSRSIQITKIELEKVTGFSDNTLAKHLKDLQTVGLVKITHRIGKHDGSIYEVFVPEELPNQPNQDDTTNPTKKVGDHPPQKVGLVGIVETTENKEDSSALRFKFKDLNIIDDEKGIIEFCNILNAAAQQMTGRPLKDWKALPAIAQIIVEEIARAEQNTTQINSFLKFAETHLRNKLKPTGKIKPRKERPSDVPNSSDIEPLGESRKIILENIRRILTEQGRESVEALKGSYLPDDWDWLMENL